MAKRIATIKLTNGNLKVSGVLQENESLRTAMARVIKKSGVYELKTEKINTTINGSAGNSIQFKDIEVYNKKSNRIDLMLGDVVFKTQKEALKFCSWNDSSNALTQRFEQERKQHNEIEVENSWTETKGKRNVMMWFSPTELKLADRLGIPYNDKENRYGNGNVDNTGNILVTMTANNGKRMLNKLNK